MDCIQELPRLPASGPAPRFRAYSDSSAFPDMDHLPTPENTFSLGALGRNSNRTGLTGYAATPHALNFSFNTSPSLPSFENSKNLVSSSSSYMHTGSLGLMNSSGLGDNLNVQQAQAHEVSSNSLQDVYMHLQQSYQVLEQRLAFTQGELQHSK
jgi:hypothetical protein